MIKIILLLVAIVSCSSMFAQFVGNEQQVNENNSNSNKLINKNNEDAGVWRSRGYFALNRVKPIGVFSSKVNSSTLYINDIYGQKTGFGAEDGYGIEFGKLYFLKDLEFPNNTKLPENMKLGINANFVNFSFFKYNWKRVGDISFNESLVSTASIKVGVLYSYNPANNLFVDAFVNVSPTMLMIANTEGFDGVTTSFLSTENVGYGLKYDFGLNFRFSRLLLGCFWNMGSTKHTFQYSTDNFSIGASAKEFEFVNSSFKSSTFNIKLGVLFK
jgi:hypothetical protein